MRRSFLLRIYFIIIIFLFSSSLFGQDFFSDRQVPRFGSLTRQDGLISLSVSSIVQDKYGFLWFGSQGGLHRYDGKQIEVFTNDPFDKKSLPNDLIQTLIYDETRDCLWIGTYSGLSRYDIGPGNFTNYAYDPENPDSLSNNVVVSIAVDKTGDIWVGTLDGLNVLTPGETIFRKIEIPDTTVRSLLSDNLGRMWIGTYGGIMYWDFDDRAIVIPDVELETPYIMTIKEPEPGRLLLGLWDGGVYEYWPDENLLIHWEVPDKRIYTVLESGDGTLWAGSWGGGLWASSSDGESFYFAGPDTSELANSVVYSLFEDDGGLVWIGTNGGGIQYLSPRQRNYRIYSSEEKGEVSIPAGKINVIYRSSDGLLWVAVYGYGLISINEETREKVIYEHDSENPHSLSSNIVNHLREDESGNFWLSTNSGLDYFDRESGKFILWEQLDFSPPALSNTIVYFTEQDLQGRVWIATYGGGVNRYDPVSGEMVVFNRINGDMSSISDDLIYSILSMKSGEIWISTNNGLSRFISDEKGFKNYQHRIEDPDSLSANNVRSLFEDSKGRLWIGTYNGGIAVYKPETDNFIHYTTAEGMPSNNVLAIVEGDDNRIWASTRGGISVIEPGTGIISIIDEQDGLYGVAFNGGGFKNDDGSIYFGGSHGISQVDTVADYENTHLPKVHITGVRVFEKALKSDAGVFNGQSLTFGHDENFISFDFVALDYEASRHNKFAYKMEGFDRDWIFSDSRSYASYTNLPPGSYEFKVKGSNNEGLWNETGASVFIQVERPWHTRWWAFFLYAAAFFAMVTLVWSLRAHRLLHAHNSELTEANTKLEEANLRLEDLSVRDALTGLYNRRYFNQTIEKEFDRIKRDKISLSIIMIDIDHFKSVNDKYGHLFGDQAIKSVSDELQKKVKRQNDFLSRYGGEEFAAVLFNVDHDGAMTVAENIRSAVEQLELTVRDAVTAEQQRIKISVSLGVMTGVPGETETIISFLGKADDALYQAKSSGRNRICLAGD